MEENVDDCVAAVLPRRNVAKTESAAEGGRMNISERENDSKKCLAADLDDLHTYAPGACGLKHNGEWAELEPGWREGCDFDCAYDGRWTQCPHYCRPRI